MNEAVKVQAGSQGFRLLSVCDARVRSVHTKGYQPPPELRDVKWWLDLQTLPHSVC